MQQSIAQWDINEPKSLSEYIEFLMNNLNRQVDCVTITKYHIHNDNISGEIHVASQAIIITSRKN